MFVTYVITNHIENIYIGHTDDLVTRIKRHNGELPSKKSSYTHNHRNGRWYVVFIEEFATRSEAMKREKQLKSAQGRQYIRHIMKKNKSL